MESNRINEILQKRGLKIDFNSPILLAQLGVEKHTLRRIINNKRKLTATELINFSKWLEVSPEELIATPDDRLSKIGFQK